MCKEEQSWKQEQGQGQDKDDDQERDQVICTNMSIVSPFSAHKKTPTYIVLKMLISNNVFSYKFILFFLNFQIYLMNYILLDIFFKFWDNLFKTVLSQLFFLNVICAKLKDPTLTKLLKTNHQCKTNVKLSFKFVFFKNI